MKIRKMQGEERFDAWKISAICFHQRVDDIDAERTAFLGKEAEERESMDDWGAFTDDGALAARIINNHLDFYLDGKISKGGGIGAVSTLPEYRNMGAVKEMFKDILRDAYKQGEVISTLFPFSHAFYRKQGYETAGYANNYEFTPAMLSNYRLNDDVRMWSEGESVSDFLAVYSEFAKNYNLSTPRDEKLMEEHLKSSGLLKERKFAYLIKVGGKPVSYLIFKDIAGDSGATLSVSECAWTCREGFFGILGFLARFDADYAKIKLLLPQGIDLMRIVRTRQLYEFKKTTHFNFMVRPVNAGVMLETLRKPADCDLVIGITDDLIPENNACFKVTADSVERICDLGLPGEAASPAVSRPACDIFMSSRMFGQMAVGAINYDEAKLLGEMEVSGKEELLRRLFVEKPIFVGERF